MSTAPDDSGEGRDPIPQAVLDAIGTDLRRAEHDLSRTGDSATQRAAGRLAGAARALLEDSPGLAVHLAAGAWEELGALEELADHVDEHRRKADGSDSG